MISTAVTSKVSAACEQQETSSEASSGPGGPGGPGGNFSLCQPVDHPVVVVVVGLKLLARNRQYTIVIVVIASYRV